MKLEVLKTRTFPIEYNPLADKLEKKSIFYSSYWFNNMIENVIPDSHQILWFGIKSTSEEPLLLLPLIQSPQTLYGFTKISGISNYYTTLFEPLQDLDDPYQLKIAIEQVINAVCQLKWDVIDLYPLNPASASYHLLMDSFRKNNRQIAPYFMYGNWYLLIQEKNFADYWILRPSQLKNTIKRKTNKLKTKQFEYRIAKHPDEVDIAIELYQHTYHASWKRDEPYPDFIPNLIKTAAEQGWLRMGLLFIDNQIAAAQLWLTVTETAYIYKLCQNPNFDEYSPGSLLTTHLMEYVIDVDKVIKVDFLSGDDHYKKDWMSHRQERWGLRVLNPKTINGLAGIAIAHLSQIKKILVNFIKT